MERLILLTVTLFSVSAFAAPSIIFGEDNRVDVYESKDSALVELARSTVAIIPKRNYSQAMWTKEIQIVNTSLKKEMNLCDGERFINQPTAAECSGFLVSESHVLTAGHCVASTCGTDIYVFDYKMENETQINLRPSPENVYKCKRIISKLIDESKTTDYALVELDRRVLGRRPLSFRRSGEITRGTRLAVIGHPSRLPTKIATDGKVYDIDKTFFMTDLDTFGGNSGSPVFNMDTHEVEGILVKGEKDYDETLSCKRPFKAGPGFAPSEAVTKITTISGLNRL